MSKVVVLDELAAEGLNRLATAEGGDHEVIVGLKGPALRAALADADGAICRSGVRITEAELAGNRRLRAIVRAGVGTDNIDKTAATRMGIVVMNTPTGNTLSTAEHTFALILALSRNIAPAYHGLIEGRWDRTLYTGSQLADKTLGIVGLGRIGQEVAMRAKAFQMQVIGLDPFLSPERASELGIQLAHDLDELLPTIDYLTVHTPLTSETRHLISLREIAKLKPGARLINCARGGIYDETALVEGLQSGKLAGVALDVYGQEPCTQSPLFGAPGVLCTPHLGASTEEAQTQVALEAAGLIVNFLTKGEIRHAVNVTSIDQKTLASLRGYLDVAYRLGMVLAQIHRGGASRCLLNYRGDVANKDTRLLSAAFCAGLLQQAIDEEVNVVNSELLLRERGIELIEQSSSEKGAFTSSITASVETDEKKYTVGGTLFGNEMPRLFRVDGYRLEAYLDGNLFVFHHQDVPGIIGLVGTIFGTHNVNIAQMAVGRDQPGGQAVGVLNLDGPPGDKAIDEVLKHPHIDNAQVVELPPAGQMPIWLQG